jgi:protocatechuate 3,4-dioxygenase beta subunit
VGEEDVTRDLQFSLGVIEGTVTNAEGEPVPSARVAAWRLDEVERGPAVTAYFREGELRLSTTKHWWRAPEGLAGAARLGAQAELASLAHCDDAGHYGLHSLEPGRYALRLTSPAHSIAAPVGVLQVGEDKAATQRLDMTSDPSAVLRLQVLDAEGDPVPDALISICTADRLQLGTVMNLAPGAADDPSGSRTISTDEQGLLTLERVHPGTYGAWIVASGHAARFVTGMDTGDQVHVIDQQPTGTLRFEVGDGALDGIATPLLLWKVIDDAGEAVFPGGENQGFAFFGTGAAALIGEHASGYTVDVLPPGSYTVQWEVHPGPDPDDSIAAQMRSRSPVVAGEEQIEVAQDTEAVVTITE